jgi:hypothetical protein
MPQGIQTSEGVKGAVAATSLCGRDTAHCHQIGPVFLERGEGRGETTGEPPDPPHTKKKPPDLQRSISIKAISRRYRRIRDWDLKSCRRFVSQKIHFYLINIIQPLGSKDSSRKNQTNLAISYFFTYI